MDLAFVCYVELKIDAIWCFHFTWRISLPLCGFPPPPTLHPYRSVCGIGVASKNYLKWQAIQLVIFIQQLVYIDRL